MICYGVGDEIDIRFVEKKWIEKDFGVMCGVAGRR